MYLVCFAPKHPCFAAETGIAAQNDARFGPGLADLYDDALHFRQTATEGIALGRAQTRNSKWCPQEIYSGK